MNPVRFGGAVIATLTAATLTGCYVIPIDHHTPPGHYGSGHSQTVTVPAPLAQPLVLQARLYPANDIAGKVGTLTAVVTDNLNGHGTFAITVNNELLQGEATRVGDSHPGFGNIYRQVYGDGRAPNTGRRGIANAAGPRGTYMSCEYALTTTARGTGACVVSNGAKYQIHFGG
mgnify:FL=1